jgi:hypothetical protein
MGGAPTSGWATVTGHFHKVDWAVRSELQLWLRRKHQCFSGTAKKRWEYPFLHERCRLYRMVGKVSHLEGLRRKPPDEDDRRAGCGKSACPVRGGEAGNVRSRGAPASSSTASPTSKLPFSKCISQSLTPPPRGVLVGRIFGVHVWPHWRVRRRNVTSEPSVE